jgi:hypothetical protein
VGYLGFRRRVQAGEPGHLKLVGQQGMVPSVLAMREMNMNLWDITAGSQVSKKFDSIRREMIPDSLMKYLPAL